MGLLKRLSYWGKRQNSNNVIRESVSESFRNCRFETMEERQVLSADPLFVGGVYIEDDSGTDSTADTFYVSFDGGSQTTEMTRIVIDGNQDGNAGAMGEPDVYFDITPNNAAGNLAGFGGAHPFQFSSQSVGISAADILSVQVADGGTRLVIDLQNFEAGDVLVFGIDVDQFFANKTDDQITSGIEFAGSSFQAFFNDPHYNFTPDTTAATGIFDYNFSFGADAQTDTGVLSGLPTQENFQAENGFTSQENRTAGVMMQYDLAPKPVTICGTVYHDRNMDLSQDAGEEGISGTTLRLQQLDASGQYINVIRGGSAVTATTDANGDYCFGEELGLQPGTYRIIEVQPADFPFSVGAIPGTVEGNPVGEAVGTNIIAEVEIPLGDMHSVDNDFGEVKGAKISGYVYHDVNFNGVKDAGEAGIANTELQLIGTDAFGNEYDVTGFTDANGFYCFENLAPGTYQVCEIQPAGYSDHFESIGTVRGATVGSANNTLGQDKIRNITVGSEDVGINYNFGEVTYATLSGHVQIETPDGNCVTADSPEYRGIPGVTIRLIDQDGNVQTTTTDANGFYQFGNLTPGEYTVVEVTPSGFLDGEEHAGTVNGQIVGSATQNDRIEFISLVSGDEAINYDFCEIEPASISGHVKVTTPDGRCVSADDPEYVGIQGVLVRLIDQQGNQLETTTDANGYYEFTNLAPGTYTIVEETPAGYLDGDEDVGQINGADVGAITGNDRISSITIGGGEFGINYDFCEIPPASICGVVYHDRNDNGVQNQGERGIAGVTLRLLDANGNPTGQEVVTGADGSYCFTDLLPGEYCIEEVQPASYYDGKDTAGTIGGTTVGTADSVADKICDITLLGGQNGIKYNFGELRPGAIEGYVHTDLDGDCTFDSSIGEIPLAGVQMELLNADGQVISTTLTDGNGFYHFGELTPGVYSVRQVQPDGYDTEGQEIGVVAGSGLAGTGSTAVENSITEITLSSGVTLTEYNFCEVPPAKLSGYVYQDGAVIKVANGSDTPTPGELRALRDGQFTSDDRPIAGVVLELRDGITGQVVTADQALTGYYAAGPIRTVTDANGYYCFDGLRAGNYAVFEVQPTGYVDNVDTPGTNDGVAINPTDDVSPFVLSTLADGVDPNNDAILRISLAGGDHSEFNNFSEVVVEQLPPTPPRPFQPPVTPPPTPPSIPQIGPRYVPTGLLGQAGMQPISRNSMVVAGQGALGVEDTPAGSYVWQLSVINDGFPRGDQIAAKDGISWRSASFLSQSAWNANMMNGGRWLFTTQDVADIGDQAQSEEFVFGKDGARPIIGDFNGDGIDEVGLFDAGNWYIDASGNRRWGQDDMWAMLGTDADHPLVGDWDGDGKDDIGVYGKRMHFDEKELLYEPGIPDSQNYGDSIPKNIPPNVSQRPEFKRDMQRSEQGDPRSDVVDHIFRFGGEDDYPIVGDWNGDGIRTIGIFRNGFWTLDVDGDGKSSLADRHVNFGQAGDIPVVGDFNGDGVEDIGVFRNGKWIIDVDGNYELDAHDKVFELGGAGDIPVVGDFDGDGLDEVGVYRGNLPTHVNTSLN